LLFLNSLSSKNKKNNEYFFIFNKELKIMVIDKSKDEAIRLVGFGF